MPSDFLTVVASEEILDVHLNQFAGWLNGDTAYYAVANPKANDASNYLLDLQNVGSGGKGLRVTDSTGSTTMITVSNSGVSMGNTPSASGTINMSAAFAMKFRNAANNADYDAIFADGADNLVFGKITGVQSTYLAGQTVLLYSGSNVRFRGNSTGVGFNAAAPIAAPDYTITNPTTNRSIDVSGITHATLAQVVGTLIQDLISYGLLQ